ncbi:carboxypeptidase regulatory-like domain-containing protein [Algoriphagus aestuariicola]|uniref:Carboxypeptidase regulatory-like domain-containing protein n=1 Tax=Algoriphagus aestuariicola TaxID=1852016 RepID=A0ABS3BYH9_9BACT|nr:carboxypeptidase regulatory-like domain-containing protein [Algoriphagus aestuariicola]MBN7803361.1 carboxypeptidase regulatory-like domain-containing protein [Algoriphagus aestuariicola]
MTRFLLFTLAFFLFLKQGQSQTTPILERKVSFSAQDERLDLFLKRLSQDAGCLFSYSPSALDVTRSVSGTFSDRPLREILEVVFEGNVQLKSKGVYVILTPKPESSKEISISGYVVDESGKGIRDATVYDPITLKSSTTDEFGYFQFEVKNPASENFELVVNKKDYADTLVLDNSTNSFQKILLKSEDLGKSIAEPMKNFWLWTKNSVGVTNLENVTDTIHRGFQFSVVPFVGTNRKISGSVINDYSLNMLGGFSGGTEKAELGGLFNINKGDAGVVQIAGLFNQVGGEVRGLQLAGLVNSAMDSVKAAQIAGLSNFTTGDVKGFQLAGLLNLATKNVSGTQIAGIANYTHRDLKGAQISGILNIARNVTGSQVGLINYSDSTTGAPVGLISFVRKGYHKVEIGADEMMALNISLRTGTRAFYNMIFAGMRPEQADSTTWAFGYGIGFSPRLGKKTYLNIEFSSQQMNKGNVAAVNLINRAYLGFDWQMARGFGLYAGPSLNWRVYDSSYTDHPDTFTYAEPKILSEKTYPVEDLASQLWFGVRAGVRFF